MKYICPRAMRSVGCMGCGHEKPHLKKRDCLEVLKCGVDGELVSCICLHDWKPKKERK